MCDCIEEMAQVSRADCTTYEDGDFVACEDNDLRTHYEVNEEILWHASVCGYPIPDTHIYIYAILTKLIQ